ncbi:hypothetical protein LT679_02030 [Mucilaginibacter roseus]|uniref:NurA domain-containing protein n=1 Tax=Mucilaginibacter roseus TaxID=1528868 RepID=A0ABS8TZW6_9SPHI|nr:hypothetical protein [Mucilaginibacter roseus]MCD8739368.1 hypothetical protein [Mucilaginibacter roseus]
MSQTEITDQVIKVIAQEIDSRNNRPAKLSIVSVDDASESPHYFEIVAFDQIDKGKNIFFAIDGSHSSQEFYNGLSIGVYAAGYIGYYGGKQLQLNPENDSISLGKSYYPKNILITNEQHAHAVYDEMLALSPVKSFMDFLGVSPDEIFSFDREIIVSSLSKLLSFCQEVLEWSLVYEIANLSIVTPGDIILRDSPLRSNNLKQTYLVKLAAFLTAKGIHLVAVTKNSPVKLELASTFKKIDNYLQDVYKHTYPFSNAEPQWQKLCCWFEIGDDILLSAYPEAKQKKAIKAGEIPTVNLTSMYARKTLTGGRGMGIFFAARLDYVEKLQNYDWVVVDLNIFDVIPEIENGKSERNIGLINKIFYELTRLTQEHYILGYPYPLVEVHSFVTIKDQFKGELMNRVKYALYHDQRMDHVDIENLFLDLNDRF